MRRGRDGDARLRRAAAEHHLEAELVGARDHRARFSDAAALLKLHVDPIAGRVEPIDVAHSDRGLVRDDR